MGRGARQVPRVTAPGRATGGRGPGDLGAPGPPGDLGTFVREYGDPLAVMRRIAEEALRLVGAADGAAVHLVDDDALRCACALGTFERLAGRRLALAGSLSGIALRTGATLRCDDCTTDPRVNARAARLIDAVSLVCVPLRCTGRSVGTLNVAATTPAAFSDRDVATLNRLSSFMTAVITAVSDLKLATSELISDVDASTNAGNGEGGGHRYGSGDVRGGDGRGGGEDAAAISDFVANILHPGALADLRAAGEVERVLAGRLFRIVYQPIVEIADGRVVMAEALSRFTPQPYRAPDLWFADAWRSGYGADLELATLEEAAAGLDRLPAGARLTVNLSPPFITDPHLADFLQSLPPDRFVIELTEHVVVADYPATRRALMGLRERGVQLAIDDTGAGFASLSHIVKLAPDIVKLDRELIHGIDGDPVRRSLGTAIVTFTRDIGAEVVAEAVETPAELETIRELGIRYAQGTLLGSPGPVDLVPPVVDLDRLPDLAAPDLAAPDPEDPSMPDAQAARHRPWPPLRRRAAS